jgi:hypothetical protein
LIDLQRIQTKILTDAPATLHLNPFIDIFGRWRADKNHPAGWVDLADYAHVPRGAGILLVGFKGNFAFDLADPAPGILYASKSGLSGPHPERIAAAIKTGLELTRRLIGEPEFPKTVHLRTDRIEFQFPDRLVTPNTSATDRALRPSLAKSLDRLFGAGGYELAPHTDPTALLGYSVKAKNTDSLEILLKRLF